MDKKWKNILKPQKLKNELEERDKQKKHCALCNKPIGQLDTRDTFVNATLRIRKTFCCHDHKLKWIYKIQKRDEFLK